MGFVGEGNHRKRRNTQKGSWWALGFLDRKMWDRNIAGGLWGLLTANYANYAN
jgi:hypothetical protein